MKDRDTIFDVTREAAISYAYRRAMREHRTMVVYEGPVDLRRPWYVRPLGDDPPDRFVQEIHVHPEIGGE